MTGEMDWNDVWRAIHLARRDASTDQEFLALLEQHGVTVAPLRLRRDCDLFGMGAMVKTGVGYQTLDPTAILVRQP
jgi:hypothetical protein